jgi:hypothetical protein
MTANNEEKSINIVLKLKIIPAIKYLGTDFLLRHEFRVNTVGFK